MSDQTWKDRWFRMVDQISEAHVLLNDCAEWLETFADESEDAVELATRVRAHLSGQETAKMEDEQ